MLSTSSRGGSGSVRTRSAWTAPAIPPAIAAIQPCALSLIPTADVTEKVREPTSSGGGPLAASLSAPLLGRPLGRPEREADGVEDVGARGPPVAQTRAHELERPADARRQHARRDFHAEWNYTVIPSEIKT